MAKSVLNRIWNRLINRYDQDGESGCCSLRIEEVQSDSEEDKPDSCCE
ncbi:hypothetical protein Natpe_2007 [Natrinema pellirubrum DSM 15624]|uniref:Uncharacterized protein n=1 Tax=Natrinema pellirubrum (strain DSM 15624 / CIP 106293 / JCM 10476 / NCIMB 786 / 157) TaxID=797303 RepID=L0JJZ5_NATP1|nr:hypothetical protein Natpe_2007 [Natrinema pellirubrum DSM 15624]